VGRGRVVVLKGIKKIKAWELSDRFVVEVYRVTKKFPSEEMYGLTSQMRRAAVSVPANIVEGSQRQYLKEYLQFLYTAKASLAEVEYYLHLSHRLEYLIEDDFKKLCDLHVEAARTLQGLIRWLKGQIQAGKVTKEDLQKRG
jgi:four helix bundle protein